MKGENTMENTTNLSQSFIDPVCAMKVNPEQTELTFAYKNHTYYFCAEACQKTFKAAPEKYLEEKPAKRKGIWGRYLDRLAKVNGGNAPSCH
jgi:YHS domain-containing protein